MTYKGYTGVVEVDEEAGELFGTVQGLRDVVTFVGATVEEARKSFEASVDFYLERCAATGKDPDRPFSGKFVVRISPEVHRQLARIAVGLGASLNEVVSDAITAYVGGGVPAHGTAIYPQGAGPGQVGTGQSVPPAGKRGKRA